MRNKQPWTFQADLFGIASVVHCMLHNEYMQIQNEGGIWRPKLKLKRYWQTDLWNDLFEAFINTEGGTLPVVKDYRAKFEKYLLDNPSKARLVKPQLCKLNISMEEAEKKKDKKKGKK
jgi:checkpoint serine/threonine-protein kinase